MHYYPIIVSINDLPSRGLVPGDQRTFSPMLLHFANNMSSAKAPVRDSNARSLLLPHYYPIPRADCLAALACFADGLCKAQH